MKRNEKQSTSGETPTSKKKKLPNEVKSCECVNISISQPYKQESFINDTKETFSKNENALLSNGAKVISKPFHCCILPNFISSIEFVNHLKNDLSDLEMTAKETDLYQFKQSRDLAGSHSTHIKALKNLLYGECLSLISEITRTPLTDDVDMTCAFYDNTDVLLCHDDQLEGRSIAFIYYLCENWKEDDGGTLDLFNSENGYPTIISESVVPDYNKFVFFEVSSHSFHQVAEILKDKCRITISGWFHGVGNKFAEKCNLLSDSRILRPATSYQGDVLSWINQDYLKPFIQVQVRKKFKAKSQIELPDFLLAEKYEEVCEALKSNQTIWKTVGPPNKRHYEEATAFPQVINEFLDFIQSDVMCAILYNFTGLTLHECAHEHLGITDSSEDSSESSSIHDEESCSNSDCSASDNSDSCKQENEIDDPKEEKINAKVDNSINLSDSKEKSFEEKNNDSKCSVNYEDKECSKTEISSSNIDIVGCKNAHIAEEEKAKRVHENPGCSQSEKKREIKMAHTTNVLRKWKKGYYTLLHDNSMTEASLDTYMSFCCEDWKEECGGYIAYVAADDGEELLRVERNYNTLALVYADTESKQFVKYVNSRIGNQTSEKSFYDVFASYVERFT